MNRFFIQILLLFILVPLSGQAVHGESCREVSRSLLGQDRQLFEQFDQLLARVRDNAIAVPSAQTELARLLPLVAGLYRGAAGKGYQSSAWVFPLAGYGPKAVPGRKGKGFVVKGYDFFTGNRHGGHPAYDIFIQDRNRDELDDRTHKPVAVLSMTGGVVVSTESAWEPGSPLRGGKYVWIYDPANDLLVYYAHNREILVKAGDLIRPGDKLALVGRSGLNAAKRRSPTHLHMMVLKADEGRPQAVRFWTGLSHARMIDCE